MRSIERDPYALCPCGSGRKYKFCCRERERRGQCAELREVDAPAGERILVMDLERGEREQGVITAFLHAAGVNTPQKLVALDEAAFRSTVAPKVQGARNVLAALDEERLKLLITFGSIIGRSGLPGEAHYAVANEWLTDLTEAFQERFPSCRCLAAEWSVWSGVGMGARLGRVELLRQQGIEPISPEMGVEILERVLSCGVPATSVVLTGRFGALPTLKLAGAGLPSLRFLEHVRVHYPGVELVVDCVLSPRSDPYLSDHILQGQALVPAVMGLEAMAQVARALLKTEALPSFENVEFRRPVIVGVEGDTTVRLMAVLQASGVVEVALRCNQTAFQEDHFHAICRFTPAPAVLGQEALLEESAHMGLGAPPLALHPVKDIYEGILFHGERFRRISNYRVLSARECITELKPLVGAEWFASDLPQDCILGCAALRDAAIHSIQACIPHVRLLPIGVGKVVFDGAPCQQRDGSPIEPIPRLFLHARETARRGDVFHYDLQLRGADGRLFERWYDLRLRKIEDLPRTSPWAEALLAPYLERCFSDLVPEAHVSVGLEGGSTREGALRLVGGGPLPPRRRADGKPELESGRSVSVAHAGALTLAVAGDCELGCDLEPVVERAPADWRAMLGSERFGLAERAAQGEPFDYAATRVWSAIECLKKSGGTASPILESRVEGKAVVFRAGQHTVATFVESVRGHKCPIVIGISARAGSGSMVRGTCGREDTRRSSADGKCYDYPLTVSFEDTNVVGNVYFANYVRWQGRVREQFLADEAPEVLAELRSGLELVTTAVSCHYESQLFALDRVLVRMRLRRLEPMSVGMVFEYYRQTPSGRELVARGSQEVGACRAKGGNRVAVALPESLRAAVSRYL